MRFTVLDYFTPLLSVDTPMNSQNVTDWVEPSVIPVRQPAMRSDTVLQIRLDFSFNCMSTRALIMTERGQGARDPYKWDVTNRTCSCYYKQHWQAESRNGKDRDHRPGTSRQVRDGQYIEYYRPDNSMDDDEYPLSNHGKKKKSIAIHKSRIGQNITNLRFQSKINSLLNTKTKQTRFFRRSSDCQASRRWVVLIGWLRSSSCHHKCNQLYRRKKIKWIFLGYRHVKYSKVRFCCKIKLDAFSLIPVECTEIKELKKEWFAAIKGKIKFMLSANFTLLSWAKFIISNSIMKLASQVRNTCR